MSSLCAAASCSADKESPPSPPPGGAGGGGDEATGKEEYDFIEQPSQEYLCPVTFELLFHPEQTTCCGHHISNEAVTRIQRDKKPCPICNKPNLTTMPDKFFRRKVHELKVWCSHKKEGGCEWVGDLGSYDDHVNMCPKRPWSCEFCDFEWTYDFVIKHLQYCVKHPIPCPNACEVKTVPFFNVESHLLECPLQLVACELAHAGCSALVARRDLPLHMKESVQQHLLSASLLNLQLTRDKIERQDQELKKKDEEMAQQLLEKENEVKERDKQRERDLKEKDLKYAEMVAEKEEILAKNDHQITELEKKIYAGVVALQKDVKESSRTIEELLAKQDGSLKAVQDPLLQVPIVGVTRHEFTLTKFTKHQEIGDTGDWNSDSFYSHPGGCRLQLNIETNAINYYNTHIAAWLRLIKSYDDTALAGCSLSVAGRLCRHLA